MAATNRHRRRNSWGVLSLDGDDGKVVASAFARSKVVVGVVADGYPWRLSWGLPLRNIDE